MKCEDVFAGLKLALKNNKNKEYDIKIIHALEIVGMVLNDNTEINFCKNCKWYDGSHKCNNSNSIATGSENRVYPDDGCRKEFEPK